MPFVRSSEPAVPLELQRWIAKATFPPFLSQGGV